MGTRQERRGRRHALAGLLAAGIAAVIAGSRSFAAIGQQSADAGQEVLAGPGAARRPAEESAVRRAFALVSPDVLDRVPAAWLRTRAVQAGGRLIIAVDGKTARGAKDKTGKAPHLAAALAHGIGAVLGQVAADAKSNEIPAVRELLKAYAGLAGAVFTMDAMHTQHDTAQAAQLRRTVTRNGRRTVEVVYLITSDRDTDPATLAAWVRGHQEIENRLHWVRDVTYQEDKSLARTGNAPRIMASLCPAIRLPRLDGHASIAAASRHHARDPQRTPKLLQAA